MTLTNEVLDRHMATFGKQDTAGVMADYAPDAVMFRPNGAVQPSRRKACHRGSSFLPVKQTTSAEQVVAVAEEM